MVALVALQCRSVQALVAACTAMFVTLHNAHSILWFLHSTDSLADPLIPAEELFFAALGFAVSFYREHVSVAICP